jgi:amino acid transporter
MTLESVKRFIFGNPLDPFKQETRKHIALITFFAWIGLGADGISSSAYGPEEAFVALGTHTHLAIFLAIATAVTVFLIAFAYLQVIELFPNGGGGYKVASTLLGPKAGLVSGSALIIDYVLTIAISVASAIDSFFSVVNENLHPYKILFEIFLVLVLTYMNLRGVKESIKFLMPIFLGFIVTHLGIISYGIIMHADGLGSLIPNAVSDAQETASSLGWFAVLAIFFKAFSMGGGTYTGLEAVSNSVQTLAEPKVRTGKHTMLWVATSLAIMAAGIIMLYLLWDVKRVTGETMNATAIGKITADWSAFGFNMSSTIVTGMMLLTAGLLFVAANTGFIAGPAVLASMAVDRWVPHLFSSLSSRLVTKNGVILMGIAAILALIITGGKVDMLVVLYSINVFLTFSLSLLGLCRYRWKRRRHPAHLLKLIVPFIALIVCISILCTTLIEKFFYGGWKTVIITGFLIFVGLKIKKHYEKVQAEIEKTESELDDTFACETGRCEDIKLLYDEPTAVFFVSETSASGMHTFSWVRQVFPSMFKNYIFVSVGEIDTEEFADTEKWNKLRRDTKEMLKKYVNFCNKKGLPATYYHAFGTDVVQKLTDLADKILEDFPNTVFFASKVISDNENFLTQMLHNQTAYILQRRLHNKGKTMIISPMKL